MKKLLIIAALLMSGVVAQASGPACAMGSRIGLFGEGSSSSTVSTINGTK